MQLTLTIDDVFGHIIPILQEPGQRAIVEIGAHDGTHSDLLRFLCRERPRYLAIEPDLRNLGVLFEVGHSVLPVAISDRSGHAQWFASGGITPGTERRIHTDSSSLKRPTKHLEAHPWCEFTEGEQVKTMTLDEATGHWPRALEIDLIWADVQGAQLEVIRGGSRTLGKTRYLFIELHPEPLYEGEPTFAELHLELEQVSGSEWEVVEHYPADVLFRRVV